MAGSLLATLRLFLGTLSLLLSTKRKDVNSSMSNVGKNVVRLTGRWYIYIHDVVCIPENEVNTLQCVWCTAERGQYTAVCITSACDACHAS